MAFDWFTWFPVCEDLLEVFGDVDSAVLVLEKQMMFIEKYFKTLIQTKPI